MQTKRDWAISLDEEKGRFFISDWDKLDVPDTQAFECPLCNGPLMHLVGEGGPLEDGEGTHVGLVAAGYEWTCPACRKLNTTSAAPTTGTVTCTQCNIEFAVNP